MHSIKKPDFSFFPRECLAAKSRVALVLGPPPSHLLSEDDFTGIVAPLLEEENISFQFIPWSEMHKDYRCLNCALDLSLLLPLAAEKKS